ncbi:MAG: hypothetical protein NZT61_05465 [Deltaproteobacteria bacterium]|nr:hypothetical protein [Deltaproteobacteria bacterium]
MNRELQLEKRDLSSQLNSTIVALFSDKDFLRSLLTAFGCQNVEGLSSQPISFEVSPDGYLSICIADLSITAFQLERKNESVHYQLVVKDGSRIKDFHLKIYVNKSKEELQRLAELTESINQKLITAQRTDQTVSISMPKVYGFGLTPRGSDLGGWLLQEFIDEAQPLSEFLETSSKNQAAFTAVEIEEIFSKFLIFLSVLEEHGVVHRDFTPANILIQVRFKFGGLKEIKLYCLDLDCYKPASEDRWATPALRTESQYWGIYYDGTLFKDHKLPDGYSLALIMARLITEQDEPSLVDLQGSDYCFSRETLRHIYQRLVQRYEVELQSKNDRSRTIKSLARERAKRLVKTLKALRDPKSRGHFRNYQEALRYLQTGKRPGLLQKIQDFRISRRERNSEVDDLMELLQKEGKNGDDLKRIEFLVEWVKSRLKAIAELDGSEFASPSFSSTGNVSVLDQLTGEKLRDLINLIFDNLPFSSEWMELIRLGMRIPRFRQSLGDLAKNLLIRNLRDVRESDQVQHVFLQKVRAICELTDVCLSHGILPEELDDDAFCAMIDAINLHSSESLEHKSGILMKIGAVLFDQCLIRDEDEGSGVHNPFLRFENALYRLFRSLNSSERASVFLDQILNKPINRSDVVFLTAMLIKALGVRETRNLFFSLVNSQDVNHDKHVLIANGLIRTYIISPEPQTTEINRFLSVVSQRDPDLEIEYLITQIPVRGMNWVIGQLLNKHIKTRHLQNLMLVGLLTEHPVEEVTKHIERLASEKEIDIESEIIWETVLLNETCLLSITQKNPELVAKLVKQLSLGQRITVLETLTSFFVEKLEDVSKRDQIKPVCIRFVRELLRLTSPSSEDTRKFIFEIYKIISKELDEEFAKLAVEIFKYLEGYSLELPRNLYYCDHFSANARQHVCKDIISERNKGIRRSPLKIEDSTLFERGLRSMFEICEQVLQELNYYYFRKTPGDYIILASEIVGDTLEFSLAREGRDQQGYRRRARDRNGRSLDLISQCLKLIASLDVSRFQKFFDEIRSHTRCHLAFLEMLENDEDPKGFFRFLDQEKKEIFFRWFTERDPEIRLSEKLFALFCWGFKHDKDTYLTRATRVEIGKDFLKFLRSNPDRAAGFFSHSTSGEGTERQILIFLLEVMVEEQILLGDHKSQRAFDECLESAIHGHRNPELNDLLKRYSDLRYKSTL